MSKKTKDYYDMLGLSEHASIKDIKTAYRKLSLKFHPDHNEGDEYFSSMFRKVNEAYAVLSDPNKKAAYDNRNRRNSSHYHSQKKPSIPKIEFFTASKNEAEYGDKIVLKWKCLNCDQVTLQGIGSVDPEGSKTIKFSNLKSAKTTIMLTAKSAAQNRQIKSEININNITYERIRKQVISEYESNKTNTHSKEENNPFKKIFAIDGPKEIKYFGYVVAYTIAAGLFINYIEDGNFNYLEFNPITGMTARVFNTYIFLLAILLAYVIRPGRHLYNNFSK